MNREAQAGGILGRVVGGWSRFWFSPADPTVLGLIRICCGLMVLYVHLAYSFDLQNFFGKHSWQDLRIVDEFRHEAPIFASPVEWDYVPRVAKPTTPEETRYVEEYRQKYLEDPPPPFPRDAAEAKAIEEYRDRWGSDPRLAYAKGRPLFSVWFHVTDPAWMRVVHTVFLLAMALFTVGFCTRVTSVLTWLGVLSYIQRSPASLFGMDTIMIVVVLYLMIAPAGAAFSVDRLLARWWLRRRARLRNQPEPAFGPSPPLVSANVALRLLQVHVCIIYFVSGVSKLQGQSWWTGTATWMTMANTEFSPLHYELYADFIRFLANHRVAWEVFMTGGTMFTLAFEIGFPFLVWNRSMRWLMLTCAVMLHTGITLFMGLTEFSLMMLTLVLSFVPATAVRKVLGLWRPAVARALSAKQSGPAEGESARKELAASVPAGS
jgi:hypothetical protein